MLLASGLDFAHLRSHAMFHVIGPVSQLEGPGAHRAKRLDAKSDPEHVNLRLPLLSFKDGKVWAEGDGRDHVVHVQVRAIKSDVTRPHPKRWFI